jgi:squalene cyclase
MTSICLCLPLLFAQPAPKAATPEERAVAFLAREVPQWPVQNKCYSCHNNGDAARALYQAKKHGLPVPPAALEATSRWLAKPAGWDHNGGDERFSDKVLARIQFASALLEAIDVGLLQDRQSLRQAAELVAENQQTDGSWKVGADGSVGSPVTYGPILATYSASRILNQADAKKHADGVLRAERWLRKSPARNVLEAASLVLALAGDPAREAREKRAACLALLRKGQDRDGGWGPYLNAASEPFDTALALLALASQKEQAELRPLLKRGRAYLLASQQTDGSWPETTRPAGNESYSQRISTTGWALLALLATRDLAANPISP